ncbi:SAM-dependent methyltransferase [Endozoicomonas montiporae]|uniref:SAM-dependent methyltransferase n=2 Tax=Endozoicomonas montiporae TaxID=1027273 RepID=A0A081NB53_9GAMM|nr:class I SAM-dependent methyltransferase [Endozoicomonas montiporae]AMO56610.1 putative O-methyltransferase [Endozoicomonas montiporae CL-33]KEQ15676.1 SAM-dependent methyltransferase [Endozoicomonas montiporae]
MSSTILTMTAPLNQYLVANGLREHSVLAELRQLTSHHEFSNMQISPEQGQMMALLTKLVNAKHTIEIGVFTGYSALAVALALPDNGHIVACDISDDYTRTARSFWEKAGVDHKIDLRLAPASETLSHLIEQQQSGTFDMAFIDADKTGYDHYYEQCLQLIRPGGLILIDNVLWSGRVADDTCTDEDTAAIKVLNRKIHNDDRVDMMILPISDGLTIAIKRDI